MDKRWLYISSLALVGCTSTASLSSSCALILKPEILSGHYTQTTITPYDKASIHHLNLKLFIGAQDTGINKVLLNAQLDNPVVFSNLKANTTYRVKAYAYVSADDSTLISLDDTNSWTDIALLDNDRPMVSPLKVRLIDRTFYGQGTGSIQVTDGGYTLAGPEAMALQHSQVYTFAGLPQATGSEDGTGTQARFSLPRGLAADSSGNLYVADVTTCVIRKITPAGVVTTLAGSAGTSGTADGTGAQALFSGPNALSVDSGGNVYVADRGNNVIRKITPTGVVSTLAGLAGATGTADGVGTQARFYAPYGITVTAGGLVYVADSYNNTIRKISGGAVTTFAGYPNSAGTVDGQGTLSRFNCPIGLAVDLGGNVFVADYSNQTVRKITPSGLVSTLVGCPGVGVGYADGVGSNARFNYPCGLVVDSSGAIFVSDQTNHLIRRIGAGNVVTTLAGVNGQTGTSDGPGASARFNQPRNLALDPQGNLYVADSVNSTIRVLK